MTPRRGLPRLQDRPRRRRGTTAGGILALMLLLGLIALLACSAFFSGFEAALFSLSRLQIHQLRERRDRASRRVLALLERPNRTLAAILVGNNLVNIALSAVATAACLRMIADRSRALEVATLGAGAAVLLLGEITPKALAVGFSVPLARFGAAAFRPAERLLHPLTVTIHGLAGRLLRGLGLPAETPTGGALLSHAELRSVLREADAEGRAITPSEGRLVQNILEFPVRTAEEIMTPRIDLVDLAVDAPREALVAAMRDSRHSRYPVYAGDPDRVIGFVQAKEYLLDPTRDLRSLLRPVAFFPESAAADRIFHEMRRSRTALVLVVNEYGEIVGLITREDLIEEIVGDIYDEFDQEETPIRRKGEGLYIVPGRIALADLNELLGGVLPEETAVTLNGFLCDVHGRIPRPGTVVAWQSLRFHVLEVARHRVHRVLLELPEHAAGEGDA